MRKIIFMLLTTTLLSWHMSAYAFNQQEANKQAVTEFYNELINNKNSEAAEKYIGSRYIQHNPAVADGVAGIRTFVEFLKSNYPQAHSDIKRIIAEHDYVVVHIHSVREPGSRGRAIVDIFKLENGKIVEHWDVIEDVPETAVNTNGMF